MTAVVNGTDPSLVAAGYGVAFALVAYAVVGNIRWRLRARKGRRR